MKMRTEAIALRDNVDDLVAHLFRIQRANANAPDAASFGDHLEQRFRRRGGAEVASVSTQMNSAEHDLLVAAFVKLIERIEQAAGFDTARLAARERHDAECAELVASFLHLEKRARLTLERDGAQLNRRLMLAQIG